MKGIVSGVISFGLMLVALVLWVYPAVFNFVKALFDNSDLGAVLGVGVCVLITGAAIQVAIVVAILIGVLIEVVFEPKSKRVGY